MDNEALESGDNKIKGEKDGSYFGEIVRFALLIAIILLPIRLFVAKPFIVSGASMSPTFESGEYLVVDELSYRFRSPARGEVIIFKFPDDPKKYFIKRIIGLPGDTVTIRGENVYIKEADGVEKILSEPYVLHKSTGSGTRTLSDGEYFMMGDNRSASHDSRSWGALPEENIVGVAFVRLFPLPRIDLHPGRD